ncbi:MAG TPA: BTAD domain-containing putative transcriptional regulator [Gemmatimonadaceae bacterium]|nr:BTAD domain-containing putative transcriptional regulator [Gemmatimonadaceae bacterium]
MALDRSRIEFRVLGGLDVRAADSRPVPPILAQPKRLALLLYLALAPPQGMQRRDTLVALFWPEFDQARARAALRKALQFLRQGLGEGVLVTRGEEEVGLAADEFWCDASAFAVAAADGRLAEALTLYRGDLAPGLFVAGARKFEEWLEGERARLRKLAARAARTLRDRCEASQQPTLAADWARRAVELAPDDERVARERIALLDRLGDRAGALHAYESLARRLADEFEVEPSPETQRLVAEVRSRATAPPASSAPAPARPVPTQAAPDGSSPSTAASADARAALDTGRSSSRQVGGRRRLAIGIAAGLALTVGLWGAVRATSAPNHPAHALRRQLTFSGRALQAAISPDGQFVAYTVSAADSGEHVVVQDLASGGADTIDTGPAIRTMEWSPDGTRLLLSSRGRVAVLPRLGGAALMVGSAKDLLKSARAYWLPDGKRVSLHGSHDKRLLVIDLQTKDSVAIPVAGIYAMMEGGSWSPDGRLFAVATETAPPTTYAIRTVGRDGRSEVVVEDSLWINTPRWSSDGATLYYVRGNEAVWRVPVSARTGRRRGPTTEVQGHLEALPVWTGTIPYSMTRDGTRMVYARGTRFSNLWRVEASGTDTAPRAARLTSGTALRWSALASPDGRWIGFAQETDGGGELFRMPIDGGDASQLTFGARVLPSTRIAWSPDGTQIAFVSLRAGVAHVWLASVSDGRLRPLDRTRPSPYTGHVLTWAPASRIAYERFDLRNIILLDPASGTERSLFADTASGQIYSPEYSPDGNRLGVAWNRAPGDAGLWVFDLRDSSRRKVSDAWGQLAGWSYDGRYLYMTGRTMRRFDARAPRAPERVFTSPFRGAACAPVGRHAPNAFVCAASEFVSDVWMIENFDADER